MNLLEDYYGRQTFVLYSLFAKIPGGKVWPRVIFLTFSITILLLSTMYQMTKLVAEKFNRDVIIKLLPTTLTTGGTLLYIPYVAFNTEKDNKELFSMMLTDLTERRTEEEDEIKERFARGARIFVKAYTTFLMVFVAVVLVLISVVPFSAFIPYFLDLLIPLNETRERRIFVEVGTFIDEKKYFYHVYSFHCLVASVVSIYIGVSENMGVIIVQHFCGMVEVLGHQLENLTRVRDHKILEKTDDMRSITNRLKMCIRKHQRILQFITLAAAFYDIPLTVIIVATFCCLTISLVQMSDPELINIPMVLFTVTQIIQLLLLSYMGQNVIDVSDQLSVKVYNAGWYLCPVNIRKLLQMIIIRSLKPCALVASSMYTFTLRNFMSVMQTVTSCYMVFRRTE